jgi:hypothetical protein
VAEVSPTLGASAGVAGSTGVFSIGGLPTGVLIDDSTVTSVRFNGAPVYMQTPDGSVRSNSVTIQAR